MTQQLEKRLIDSLDSIRAKGRYDIEELLISIMEGASILELFHATRAVSKKLGIDLDASSAGPQSSDEQAAPAEEKRYSIKIVKPADPEKVKILAENKMKILKLLGEIDASTQEAGKQPVSLIERMAKFTQLETTPIILAQGLTKADMEAKKKEFFEKVPIEFVIE